MIAPSDFLAAPRAADEVKAELSGRVIPAVRDAEGLLRLFVPRSVDLWFKRGTPPAVAKARIESLGLQPRREASESLQALGFYPCELTAWPDGDPFAAMLEVIDRAQDLAEVRFAEPDEIGIGDFAPDRSSPLPRASEFEAAERFWNHDLCGLTAAHAITRGSDKVIVFTVDSGIATAHPDLAGELRPGWQQLDLAFATDEDAAESSPESAVAHGTKVGSIAVGNGNAAAAVLGIAPGCRLLPIRISGDATSTGYGMRAAAILHALSLIGQSERAVINLSWGMAGDHIGVRTAIEAAGAAQVVVTMSAGNYVPGESQTSDQLHYPSIYCRQVPGAISVGAVSEPGRKASYSFYGRNALTLCAPGGEAGGPGAGLYAARSPADHDYTYGTSFSVVHACGAAALMLSANPALTAERVVEILRASGRELGPEEPLAAEMGPLLDIAEAVTRASREAGPGHGPPPEEPERPPVVPVDDGPPPVPAFPVNINTAGQDELLAVPSMSEGRATIIVADRADAGPYASLWDLRRTGAFTTFIINYWQQEGLLTV